MPDHAISASPAVQAQLDRLTALSPGADILGLERITALLARLGDPQPRAAPGVPCRRHQRQGIDLRLPARRDRGGGPPRPRLFQPAPRPLQRAHPPRRHADRRRDPRRAARRGARRRRRHRRQLLRGHHRRRLPRLRAHPRRRASIVEVGLGGRLDATNVIPAPARLRHRRARRSITRRSSAHARSTIAAREGGHRQAAACRS